MTDRTLLPNEPRILDWAQELALTGQYLLPALRELEVFFLYAIHEHHLLTAGCFV